MIVDAVGLLFLRVPVDSHRRRERGGRCNAENGHDDGVSRRLCSDFNTTRASITSGVRYLAHTAVVDRIVVLLVTSIMSMVSRVPFQLSGRYAERNRFEVLDGPGDSRVTGEQIIKDENFIDAWGDKVVLITGVSSGMGVETVRAIASTGATVYGTARNLERAREALGSLLDTGRVHLIFMDQADLASVRASAEEFRRKSSRLNVIINNAAVSERWRSDPRGVGTY